MKRVAHISEGYITNVSLAKDDAELRPGTMLESDAIAQGLTWKPKFEPKQWPNIQAFMSEFTMPELAGIGISTDPTVAALRVKLSTWFTQVNSDSDEVQLGLSKLVELGIITAQRKESILSQSP